MSQTVDRALSILPLLAEGPADLGRVADRLDVHKSTALRLLRTLVEHGLVYRQSDGRYRLGARLFSLAQEAIENLDVREIAHHHLVQLGEVCGHTVHLAVYEEGEVLYIDKVDSRYPVRMYSRVGKPVPMSVAAVSKLLLADLPEAERRAVAERLDYPMYTPRSTPSATAFLKELAGVREQGWATDLGGHEESINCVAAPIRGADGRAVAAMSVSAPNVVVTAEDVLGLLPLVRRTADAISREYSGQHSSTAPGHSNTASGHSSTGPGHSRTASGHSSAGDAGPARAPRTGGTPQESHVTHVTHVTHVSHVTEANKEV
ncbi:helix-turn-helix domain-containing protein [Streptomyces tsukubensis]|nr:IclR family transcriptional regulator C-terminal domain-containing protein [Streptomyces tsukubensis]QFR95486.1 helix-turn-helix domain-containing protein [Streptomyces tsukubensis]